MPRNKSQKTKPRPFPWPCPHCLTLTVFPTVTDYTAKVRHEGVIHSVHVPELDVPRCTTCGEMIITMAADTRINDALRAQLHLLTPAQMRKAIRDLGLYQKDLAKRLGVAPETVSRWVTGGLIQSRAMDQLLRAFFAFPQVRKAFQGAGQDPQLGTVVR